MQCQAIASDGVTSGAAVRPAAPAGPTPLMCDAVLCRRAGCGPYCAAASVCKWDQQPQRALHLLRALQRHAMVPDVTTHGAAVSAGSKCQQHQQALRLSRAMRRCASVPVVIACSAAISVCGKSKRHQQALHLLPAARGQAVASDVVTHSAALTPAASAGRTSLSCKRTRSRRRGGPGYCRASHNPWRFEPLERTY